LAKSDLEGFLGTLLSNPNNAKTLGDLEKYKSLLGSPEGKALLSQLSGNQRTALTKAAQDASQGDTDSARKLISSLLSTPDGMKLAKSIMDMMKK